VYGTVCTVVWEVGGGDPASYPIIRAGKILFGKGEGMAKVIFWEKPGCQGNARQKEILLASGHELEVRNLLTEPWTKECLAHFFGTRPVAEWFNMTNPRVKAGEIVPTDVTRDEALSMMVSEPLLIVRPLMQVGGERLAGFDVETVHNWIGLKIETVGDRDPKNCPCVTSES
jgi:nitrogenase-associated protein